METLKKEDLKENEIYYHKTLNEWIIKFEKIEGSQVRGKSKIKINDNTYDSYNYLNSYSRNFIRLATPEEKHWFLECEKANKFISREEAMKSFKRQPEFVVGKWYKNIGINKDYIGKFKEIKNNNFYCDGYIFDGKYIATTSGNLTSEYDKAIECTLEEIQQYLPYGHVDKIVKSKNMFIQNDYIILLKGPEDSSYKVNFCYKQRENNSYLLTYLDSKNSDTNGWSIYDFNKTKELGGVKTDWRYATKEEIAEYDRLGKPYNVTILSKTNVNVNLIKGKYYVAEFPSKPEWDSIFISGGELINNSRVYINPSNHKYEKGGGSWVIDSYKINFREANTNEIKWLDDCIKNNKFVPKESSTELTSLPEKWCIKLSTKEINDAVNKSGIYGSNLYWDDNISYTERYLGYDKTYLANILGYTEITFEQFKKWVLKDEVKQEEKSLVGRYVKILSDWRHIKKGEYLKILRNQYDDIYELEEYGSYARITHDLWELMPEGFEPNKVETMKSGEQWIPKVGDWVVITKSKNNWNIRMDEFNGSVVQVTSTIKLSYSELVKITFDGKDSDKWDWNQVHDHFRKAEPHEIPIKSNSNIPEYVECINLIGDCKVGGIFKLRGDQYKVQFLYNSNNSNSRYLTIHEGWDSIGSLKHTLEHFKPSTKEAFDKQNSKSTEIDYTKWSKEDLLEEARKRYPAGTIFIASFDGYIEAKVKGNFNINKRGGELLDDIYCTSTDIKTNIERITSVYKNGKWAEIVSKTYTDTLSSPDYIGKTVIKDVPRVFWNAFEDSKLVFPELVSISNKELELLSIEPSNILDTKVNQVKSISTELVEPSKVLLF